MIPTTPQASRPLEQSEITNHPSKDRERFHRIGTAAFLLLLPVVYFYPAVLGRLTLAPGDGWTANLGLKALVGKMIAEGHLPLWNPYIFAGMPFLASIYPGVLYPPNWLFALLPLEAAMAVVVITTYHLALIGTYLYARRIGCNRTGALVAGIAFAFGGFLIAHLGQTSHIASSVWLPWLVLALEGVWQTRSWRWVSLGAFVIAMQIFAGVPQACLYTAMVAGAYGLFRFIADGERRWAFAAQGLAMALCGVLLACIQLIPLRELLSQTARAGVGYDVFASMSLPPVHTLGLIFPYFFGGSNVWPYHTGYWGASGSTELCGYVGLLTLLLGFIALISRGRNQMVGFWAGVAFFSLLLAFGSYLPFGLNHLLYHVPVYDLFRVSARNLLSVNFALAVLAGLGATAFRRSDNAERLRLWRRGAAALSVVVIATLVIYRFFADQLLETKPPAGTISLLSAVAIIPLILFALSVIVLRLYAMRPGVATAAAMVVVAALDVASFGHFIEWRAFEFRLADYLPDPPTVKLVKERESDLNSFRVLSHAPWPYGYHYQLLDHPDFSILRGLQSVNGYDMLQLNRLAALAGDMTSEGVVTNPGALSAEDQSFNLLNVKYMFKELPIVSEAERTVLYEGLRFGITPLNAMLGQGAQIEIPVGRVMASELLCLTNLGDSLTLPDGIAVAQIRLYANDGRVIERELQAGRDTSEWAYDKPEVQAGINHRRARVIQSWDEKGFQGHLYLSRFPFDRTQIARIEVKYLLPRAQLQIERASLLDGATGLFVPLNNLTPSPDRWRKLAEFGQVAVYENLKSQPRAWFVRRAAIEPGQDVLQIIRSGKMKDGAAFVPAEAVLFEKEDFGNREITLPAIGDASNAEVKVTRYEPNRIELQTRNPQPGFLVLSEIYYRGWEAWIDGKRTPVERVDYALRGLAVPAGDHRIEFVFRAHGFRNGAAYSLLGVLLLFVSAGAGRSGRARRFFGQIESKLDRITTLLAAALHSTIGLPSARLLRRLRSASLRKEFSRALAVCALTGLFFYGWALVRHASYAVGGSDSSGYARIARSLLEGHIAQSVQELERLGLGEEYIRNFLPLAYVPGPSPGTMTPFYPVGLPLHMAAAAWIGGWERGLFWVSPVCAMLSVLLIFLTGRELGLSRIYAMAGAVMLAVNPTFIFMAISPMSDTAATCWSLAAIWAALRSRKNARWALLAGAAFGMGFLIRPTGALLLIPVLLALQWNVRSFLYFVLGGMPLATIFFAYNAAAYGHPLQTGYASIGLYNELKRTNFTMRLTHYVSWLARLMSPFFLLGWLAVTADRRAPWRDRVLLLTWFGAYLLFYSCYDIYDSWWYTRFILPSIPALILGTLLAVRDLPRLFKRTIGETGQGRPLRWALPALLAIVIVSGLYYVRQFDLLRVGESESVHVDACRLADKMVPEKSLILSMQMSGALKFYTQRMIVRWDEITPDQWLTLKSRAAERGYQWSALLMDFEIEEAQKRLPGKWQKLGTTGPITLWQFEPSEPDRSLTLRRESAL